ncbi:helix-turn-helix domain-containing protein [Ponticaulis sp.]|uniref:helix-turn-helix domain-containing protein n=1 Tax=Ponticaulis sp. TaxID=2020902 RepID=UPI000B729214|nr:helix-turn-helix domain-containing protein [Ponticaulis sp.]MAI90565.1 hypothetical protein [Ponticaulis sp.]OUX99081.1 MAG: hypothetical protein CBB65_09010 [Hyphomonadaceae bacterium TMED5]|tara:strand:- start:2869 stop:3963 length:1095 start_codon:yes stop_codon:yes gene_type:complete
MTGLNSEEIEAALTHRGLSIPQSTLRSWRESGLLPPAKRGGLARYPEHTVEQAIAADRLFNRKNQNEFVGWNLWLEGFEVSENFWRPHFENSARSSFRTVRKVASLLTSADDNKIDEFENGLVDAAAQSIAPKPLKAIVRRMDADALSGTVSLVASAFAGNYQDDDDADTEKSRIDGVATLSGMSRKNRHTIHGESIKFRATLQLLLRSLAATPETYLDASLFGGNRLAELHVARDYFRHGFEAGANLHEAMRWIYGNNAFGLKLAHWFRFDAPIAVQASLICLALVVLREESDAFHTLNEIRELKTASEEFKAQSLIVQQLGTTHAEYAELLSPKSLKAALRSEENINELSQKIRHVRDSLLV